MLSDENLMLTYKLAFKGIWSRTMIYDEADIAAGLRAVAEAAVKAEREGQEPVGYVIVRDSDGKRVFCETLRDVDRITRCGGITPVYTTPPAAPVPEGWMNAIKAAVAALHGNAGPLTREAAADGLLAMLAASKQEAKS